MAMELARVSYDASLRRLDKQDDLLGEIRSRTGLLLAASSLAASFLGNPALGEERAWLVVPVIAAFALSLAASMYVLLPKRNLVFSIAGSKVFEELYEFRDDPAEVHRRLAYDLDRFWEQNDHVLQRVLWSFRVAAVALGVEVALLLVSISATLG